MNSQAGLARKRPNLLLLISANGKQEARQKRARQAKENVGLVLVTIETAVQLGLTVVRQDAGVMSCGDVFGLQLPAIRPEFAELQPVIAHHARVRRPPG